LRCHSVKKPVHINHKLCYSGFLLHLSIFLILTVENIARKQTLEILYNQSTKKAESSWRHRLLFRRHIVYNIAYWDHFLPGDIYTRFNVANKTYLPIRLISSISESRPRNRSLLNKRAPTRKKSIESLRVTKPPAKIPRTSKPSRNATHLARFPHFGVTHRFFFSNKKRILTRTGIWKPSPVTSPDKSRFPRGATIEDAEIAA
jgi:hypothetical protein